MREFTRSSSTSTKKSSSKFSLINGGKEVKFHIQSNDPDDMYDEEIIIPSVHTELLYNFKNYHVERGSQEKDYLRINAYPPIISTIVDTIRTQITEFKSPPGEHPSLCCMISLGIPQIQAKRVVQKLGELNMAFKRRQKRGNDLELYVQNFLRSGVDCPVEKSRNIIIKLTSEVNDVLTQLSFDTGLTKSSAAILAIYAALAQQIETPPNYKEQYQSRFDTTINMLECKLDAAKAMIEKLDELCKGA